MDIEFHYYMTYLIANKAGFSADDAHVIAHSSQYVDDNEIIFEINKDKASAYRNYISQTMNILKPKMKLMRIYPIFHFIPGDPMSPTAWRKDGKMHWLNTTPNSDNANKIIDAAISDGDLYRIGISSHGFADTWAHQNFVGYYDDFNAMADPLAKVLPNIGHADAEHNPDWPALVWKDGRLIHERVDNRERFLDAAAHLLEKYMKLIDPKVPKAEIAKRQGELRADLDKAIGGRDQTNAYREERIARYIELSATAAYGDRELVRYDNDHWFDDVVNEDVRGLRDRSDSKFARYDPFTDVYTWKDDREYRNSHWYRFQESVKRHQDESWAILGSSNLQGLELAAL